MAPAVVAGILGGIVGAAGVDNPAVNVFLDCGYRCDEDYLRTEITYVNWVRDRAVADVHLLVTTQSTGGSGLEYTLAFIGQSRFARLVAHGNTPRAP